MSGDRRRDRDRFVDDPKWATAFAAIAVGATLLAVILKACGWV